MKTLRVLAGLLRTEANDTRNLRTLLPHRSIVGLALIFRLAGSWTNGRIFLRM